MTNFNPSNIFGDNKKEGKIILNGPEALSFLNSMGVAHIGENLNNALNELEDSLPDCEEDENKEELETKILPSYVNLTIHRSQLEIIKNWLGSLSRPESVAHIDESKRDIVAHSIQDFYLDICNALEKKVSVDNRNPRLSEEEKKFLEDEEEFTLD